MKRAAVGMALAMAWAGAVLAQEKAQAPNKPVQVGEKVPNFTTADLAGKAVTLAELQKRSKTGVVVLTFWCTICTSCRGMEGRLEALHKANQEKAGVYALDANASGETAQKVLEFMKQKRFTFPVLMDTNASVTNLFGVGETTTTLIIGADGVLRYRGRFDDPRAKATYAADALGALLEGKPVAIKQTAPIG